MIGWALNALLGATFLMLLVLAVRRPVAHAFGAGWAYALWLLPLLRLLMPPISLPGGLLPSELPRYTVIIPTVGEAAASSPPVAGGPGQWVPLLLALWAGGAAVFFLWQQSSYGAFLLHLGRDGRRAVPPEFGGIPVVESEAVDGPLAVGLLERRIVVPLDFSTRYSPAERALALDHELIHHRRGDIWWNMAALAVLALNWFNPIAWIAYRAFRTDQELACDAAVAASISASERHDYARALIKSASRPGQIAACPLNGADQLKRRLKMMKTHRASALRTTGGIAALAVLLAGGISLSSPGRTEGKRDVIVNAPVGSPLISDKDVATLREKCGGEGQAIVCSGAEAKDPQVRKIMARTEKRVREHVKAAVPSKREMAEIRKSVEAATKEIERIDFDAIGRNAREAAAQAQKATAALNEEHLVDVQEALAEAREDHADVHKIRAEALREAHKARDEALKNAMIEIRMAHAEARAERNAAIRIAIAQAKRAMDEVKFDHLEDIHVEIENDLDHSHDEDPETH